MRPFMQATGPRSAGRIAQAEAKFSLTVLEVNDGNPETMNILERFLTGPYGAGCKPLIGHLSL